MTDGGSLAQIASIVVGFAAAMLVFRIQRETQMAQQCERTWLPWSDWLLILAAVVALFLVVLPLICTARNSLVVNNLARGGCAASIVMLGGYIPSILAHYRLIFGRKRDGPRDNPEPAEKAWVLITIVVAVVAATIAVFTGIP